MMGLVDVPTFISSLRSLRGGNLAFRHVAWRAKQARCGAIDELVETEEMLDARDERSETIDSGLEPYEVALIIDGRLESE